MDFTLVLENTQFPVPKRLLLDFFDMHPCLFDESSYQVQSRVSIDDFTTFVGYLKSKWLPDITTANVKPFILLSEEFGAADLSAHCSHLVRDLIGNDSYLTAAVAELKTTVLSQSTLLESFHRDFSSGVLESVNARLLAIQVDFENRLSVCTSASKSLCDSIPGEIGKLKSQMEADLSVLKSACDEFRIEIDEINTIPRHFLFDKEHPLKGIICDLTRRHDANVHDKGIVNVTYNSLRNGLPRNIVDLTSRSEFVSEDSLVKWMMFPKQDHAQWLCWEFREALVRLTHYTLVRTGVQPARSWVIEGSLDGENWTVIDRRRNDAHLREDGDSYTYDVKNSVEYRFLRLNQPGSPSPVCLRAVEFFGDYRMLTPRRVIVCPIEKASPSDGITAYLTRKYASDIRDKGIIAITSKSVSGLNDVWIVADLCTCDAFKSEDEPGQWICWDFREMRVLLDHYQIFSSSLRSWVLEGSLDAETWIEMDRQQDMMDLKGDFIPVQKPAESRFIRLTQTAKNGDGNDALQIMDVEFFGTLWEGQN